MGKGEKKHKNYAEVGKLITGREPLVVDMDALSMEYLGEKLSITDNVKLGEQLEKLKKPVEDALRKVSES